MTMIELTTPDGLRIAINPATIWHVRPATGTQTAIYSTTGAAVFVREGYDEVVAALRPAGSAGA